MNQGNRRSADELSRLASQAGNSLNMKPNEVKQAVESGKVDHLLSRLPANDADRIKAVLNDEQKTRELLNSPAAQALLKKLMNQ